MDDLSFKVIAASDIETDSMRELAWGDYWVKKDLEAAIERQGQGVVERLELADIAVYLFGLPPERLGYECLPQDVHKVVWIHSHPDMVTPHVLGNFDKVYCQSEIFAEKIREWAGVEVLVGATSKAPMLWDQQHEVVFVGNARSGLSYGRRIIRDLGDLPYNIKIWGQGWEGKVPSRYLAGGYVANEELDRLYASSKIVLNDHHDDMAREGFTTFRLYDALAVGACVISDRNPGIDAAFGDCVLQYETAEELRTLIAEYLEDEAAREDLVERGRQVAARYTFDEVARVIVADALARA